MKKSQHIKPFITAFAFLFMVAIVGGLGTFYSFAKSRTIATRTLPSISHLALANQYRGQAFLHLIRRINSQNPKETEIQLQQIKQSSDLGYNELDLYEDNIQTQENRNLYNNLIQGRGNYINCRDTILSLAESGKIAEANRQLVDGLLPLYENYLNQGQALVNYATTDANEQLHSIRLISILSQAFAIISSVLIFIFGFMLGYTR